MKFRDCMNPPERYNEKAILYKFGLALRYVRKQRGISQTDLAKAISIDRSCISQYEVGDAHPKMITLIQICNALDMGVEELLTLCDRDNFYVEDVYHRGKK